MENFVASPVYQTAHYKALLSVIRSTLRERTTSSSRRADPLEGAGYPPARRVSDMPVTVRDISAAGIGVVAASFVDAGRGVVIHIHGHTASGVVEDCRVEDEGFYIAIALAP